MIHFYKESHDTGLGKETSSDYKIYTISYLKLKTVQIIIIIFCNQNKNKSNPYEPKKKKKRIEYYSVSKLFVVKGRQPFDLVSLSLISPASVNHAQHYIVLCSN